MKAKDIPKSQPIKRGLLLALESHRYSLKDLAEAMNIKYQSVWKMFNQNRDIEAVKYIQAVSGITGNNIESLMDPPDEFNHMVVVKEPGSEYQVMENKKDVLKDAAKNWKDKHDQLLKQLDEAKAHLATKDALIEQQKEMIKILKGNKNK